MEYDHVLIKFCERKLNPDSPEYFNALSASYISAIGYCNIISKWNSPNSNSMSIIYWCIFINGLAAFFYHLYAWYIFKLFDEFSMIIPIWFGLSKILFDLNYNTHYIGLLTLFNILLLVLDVFLWFDDYFSICFMTELLLIIPLYLQSIKYYGDVHKNGIKGIVICSVSGIVWVIAEHNCNKYTFYGHSIWHIGLSTGLCYIIKYFSLIRNIKFKRQDLLRRGFRNMIK